MNWIVAQDAGGCPVVIGPLPAGTDGEDIYAAAEAAGWVAHGLARKVTVAQFRAETNRVRILIGRGLSPSEAHDAR